MKTIGFLKQFQMNHKKGVLPLLGVSLIVFLVTVAVYFAADYVASSYQQENNFSGWSYQYTEKPGGYFQTYDRF